MERRISHFVRDGLVVVSCYAALIAAGWIAVGWRLDRGHRSGCADRARPAAGVRLLRRTGALPPARPHRTLTGACCATSERLICVLIAGGGVAALELMRMGAGDPEVRATGAMRIVARPSRNGSPAWPGLRREVTGGWSVLVSLSDERVEEVRVAVRGCGANQPGWEALA